MKNLKKNLQSLNRDLKALAKKADNLVVALDKLEQSKSAKTKPAKKMPVKKAAAKKSSPATAADTVLGIIKRSKKGINTETLMKKTGYNQKKIANLIYKLKKQGRIKTVGKGVYVKA
jgi:predicted Rossmann fold nucleotide-binding protein DprA/Smf involved in DNA uptake